MQKESQTKRQSWNICFMKIASTSVAFKRPTCNVEKHSKYEATRASDPTEQTDAKAAS
jgi:hypothetical protein